METEQKSVLSSLNTKDSDFVYAASKSIQTFKPDAIFDNLAVDISEEDASNNGDSDSESDESSMGVEYRKEGITAVAPIKVRSPSTEIWPSTGEEKIYRSVASQEEKGRPNQPAKQPRS